MRTLNIASVGDTLPPAAAAVTHRLPLDLSTSDAMYEADCDDIYLACGASALNVVLAAQALAGVGTPRGVLDFGAGAGRVTRWLRAAFPEASVAACDLRAADMDFCRAAFAAETWVSGTDIEALQAPGCYDLIWVGSVATHLSAAQTARLVDKLLRWTNPGGLVVMSLLGRTAAARRDHQDHAYIHDAAWAAIARDYEESGFGYADYHGQTGYGVSLTKLSWTGALTEHLPAVRLVLLAEGVWDGLHDVVALQRLEEPLRVGRDLSASAQMELARMSTELEARRRGLAIDRSRLWRALEPVRSLARFVLRR